MPNLGVRTNCGASFQHQRMDWLHHTHAQISSFDDAHTEQTLQIQWMPLPPLPLQSCVSLRALGPPSSCDAHTVHTHQMFLRTEPNLGF